MPLSVALEPYRISRKIELRATDVFDPTDEQRKFEWKQDDSDEDVSLIRVVGQEWTELSIAVAVTIPDSEINRILPTGANIGESTALLLSIRSSPTRFREVVRLEPEARGRWVGEVRISRTSLLRQTTIVPILTRATRTETEQDRIAGHYGAIIGEGRPLRLQLDPFEVHIGGSFKISWEKFNESTNSWRLEHDDDVFHLDLSGPEPLLVLNLRYSALRAALHSSTSKGVDAVMRHLTNGLIAQTVWLQLIVASVAAIGLDDETAEVAEPPAPWQVAVLRTFLPRLYPGLSQEERLKRAISDVRDPIGALAFISMSASAIQDHIKTFRLIEQAARAGEEAET